MSRKDGCCEPPTGKPAGNPEAPYATLLTVLSSYVHPETEDLERLQRAVKRPDLDRMQVFKRELREVMADPSVLPDGALATAAEYEDGSPEAFLSRLRRELYGDEPV